MSAILDHTKRVKRDSSSGRFILRDGIKPVASGKPAKRPTGGSAIQAKTTKSADK